MSAEFDLYEDARGKWRWRLIHQNGNIIADSGQGYADRSGARKAIERMQDYGPKGNTLDVTPAAFEIFQDAAGEWRWRLRHQNGNILADSGEAYGSRAAVETAIESVKRDGPNAQVEEISNK